jgi:hypothetical protein
MPVLYAYLSLAIFLSFMLNVFLPALVWKLCYLPYNILEIPFPWVMTLHNRVLLEPSEQCQIGSSISCYFQPNNPVSLRLPTTIGTRRTLKNWFVDSTQFSSSGTIPSSIIVYLPYHALRGMHSPACASLIPTSDISSSLSSHDPTSIIQPRAGRQKLHQEKRNFLFLLFHSFFYFFTPFLTFSIWKSNEKGGKSASKMSFFSLFKIGRKRMPKTSH